MEEVDKGCLMIRMGVNVSSGTRKSQKRAVKHTVVCVVTVEQQHNEVHIQCR